MLTKLWAITLSFFSFFALWSPNAQPNSIPEIRSYVGEVPDTYNVWPTDDFIVEKSPFIWGGGLEFLFSAKGFFTGGHKNESLLVLHRGKIVYENYAEGWNKDSPHFMASVTKSFLSALVGIAIGEGYIEGVDQKVIEFYPDAAIAPGQESKRDMTIEHLLTMTSGLPGDSDQYDWENWCWWDAGDAGRVAFETPQMTAPGKRYSYSSGPSCQTLAGIVSRATGKNLFAYANEKLFEPLGMKSVEWDAAADGSNFGGYGLSMTPRDMARFGYLYLNNGRWEDKQIIPAQWVAVTPPKSKALKAYGYLFWNFPLLPFDSSYEANGAFGQYIEILPAWDMVIVRTGFQGPLDVFISDIGSLLGIN